MRKYANVGVSRANSIRVTEPRRAVRGQIASEVWDTGNNAQLRHAHRFESEKLLNLLQIRGTLFLQ
jgi:hypothetical protein